MSKKELLIGAHVSIAGGFYKAILQGEEIGATCIQIFTKSNRQWHAKKITEHEINLFMHQQKNSTVNIVVAHASYLINLGSTVEATVQKSIHALAEELQRCDALNIPYLVLHPGTLRYENEETSLVFIANQINTALQQAEPQRVMLLLETMAGQGNTAGYTFEQLATIMHHIKSKSLVGVCFDTCHAFASGYKFDTPELYETMWQKFDKTIGIKNLKVFHVNDSKKGLGSKVDRHEDIGKGMIGANAFKLIMHDKRFARIPKIIETPLEIWPKDHQKNIDTLVGYYQKTT